MNVDPGEEGAAPRRTLRGPAHLRGSAAPRDPSSAPSQPRSPRTPREPLAARPARDAALLSTPTPAPAPALALAHAERTPQRLRGIRRSGNPRTTRERIEHTA